ncbi:MAG: FAD-dependent oxidoreductase [Candidatus Omnitrophota bacterium]
MIEFETEVLDIIQRTHNVKSFRLRAEEGAGFKPGQYLTVTIKIGNTEKTKPFSCSNSPTEKGYLEFTKKLTGSDFSRALDKLKDGGRVKVKMPFGSFVLRDEYKKIAFLSGGIGITPIRSICKYVADKKLDTDIILLYGNRTRADIVFKEDFEAMQKESSKPKVVHILSQPEQEWRGRSGYINAGDIKEEIADYAERKFYICGPPAMVEAMNRMLLDGLKIDKNNIVTENFRGY